MMEYKQMEVDNQSKQLSLPKVINNLSQGLEHLPFSIVGKIFGYLLINEVFCICNHVCRNFGLQQVNWSVITLCIKQQMDTKMLNIIFTKCFPKIITTLNLSKSYVTPENLYSVTNLRQLQNLDLSCCHLITDEGLRHLGFLTQLQNLNLSFLNKITDEGLRHLNQLTQLLTLDLSSCEKITEMGLSHLYQLTELHTLDLFACGEITDKAVYHLCHLTKLQYLTIDKYATITDEGLCHLRQKIQNLNIIQYF